MAKDKIEAQVSIKNRKASFEYEFLDTYTAGIQLKGTEIKSIRQSKVNMQDAHCVFNGDELFVVNLHISPYTEGTHYNHEPRRQRKLLLKRTELRRLHERVEEKGLTIVPTRLFINDRGLAKLNIALARGKKLYDKRESIKERDTQRELDRMRF
ncbi:SsrA-binding protein [Catalinimonas alkaloidigena]|uniref:SsrA-binding protein n=1 Tax=Catalinimonas alkaloidigena TaxID=1075417 RepID=A0A1G9UQM4_9BACT|nr:SsrA-binding protein SmpB [Catalinimonas alkaloidigena]SDM62133.1 SsrA-binding protein [Catalinimonas alkaloidigena]